MVRCCRKLRLQSIRCCRAATKRLCFADTLQFRIALVAEEAPSALESAPPWLLLRAPWVPVETPVETPINFLLVNATLGLFEQLLHLLKERLRHAHANQRWE